MRILMSMFGWDDEGGGTIMPRQMALALQRAGHEVMVIYAGAPQIPNAPAYSLYEHVEQGVKLVGIFNRPAVFLDAHNPEREVLDPVVRSIFARYFDQFCPEVVHYHNFLGLSLGIADVAFERGIPSFYTPYNFWLLCPTLYLTYPNLALCRGVNAVGSNCLSCTQAALPGSRYVARRDQLRSHYHERVGPCLATSECVRDLLLENGYDPAQVELLKLANGRAARIWEEVGATRRPGVEGPVQIGFVGQMVPIKGVHVLVAAAQYLQGDFQVVLHGGGPESYVQQLRDMDTKGVVTFTGRFDDADHGRLLAAMDVAVVPSVCFDHSPLVISEFRAARIPVVGADIGGIPDYIPTGAGSLFEAGNAQALAAVLQALIDEPQQIALMQDEMECPPSFDDYISALEARYIQAIGTVSEQQYLQRAQQLLRAHTEPLYWGADTLIPLPAPVSDYGMTLSPTCDPVALAAPLAQAQWVVYGSAEQGAALQQWAPTLPAFALSSPWPETPPGPLGELPVDQPHRLLLPLRPESTDWQDVLAAYLRVAPADAVCLLLPWGWDVEEAQEHLLQWMEQAGFNPDTAPEMVLLESQTLAQIPETLSQVTLLACPPAAWSAWLPLVPHVLAPSAPESIWTAASPPVWQTLLAALSPGLLGWGLTHTRGAYEQQRLDSLLTFLRSRNPLTD